MTTVKTVKGRCPDSDQNQVKPNCSAKKIFLRTGVGVGVGASGRVRFPNWSFQEELKFGSKDTHRSDLVPPFLASKTWF